ncbi:MAG: cold shock domain-containing protein [Synechococcales cyanobacterium]
MKPGLHKGQLIKWNDDRGFGFVKPSEGGKDIFLHISAIETTGRRPQIGDTIFYSLVTEADGKIRAVGASIQGVSSQSPTLAKAKTVPRKQRRAKHGLREPIFGLVSLASIVLIQMQFSPSRTPPLIKSITQPDCLIKGNISVATGDKLYHAPGMEDYDATIIDPSKGERWFCSTSEAVAAGWRRAPR